MLDQEPSREGDGMGGKGWEGGGVGGGGMGGWAGGWGLKGVVVQANERSDWFVVKRMTVVTRLIVKVTRLTIR